MQHFSSRRTKQTIGTQRLFSLRQGVLNLMAFKDPRGTYMKEMCAVAAVITFRAPSVSVAMSDWTSLTSCSALLWFSEWTASLVLCPAAAAAAAASLSQLTAAACAVTNTQQINTKAAILILLPSICCDLKKIYEGSAFRRRTICLLPIFFQVLKFCAKKN